jgi:allophanate hydrolase subunit 2
LPIILLADCGTTGGYTKIATVISVDLPKIGQAQPGDTVTFRAVSLEEAHRTLREQEELIGSLKN